MKFGFLQSSESDFNEYDASAKSICMKTNGAVPGECTLCAILKREEVKESSVYLRIFNGPK